MLKHYVPSSLADALDFLSKNDCFIMAGGTDLMVQKHRSSGLLPTFERDVLYVNDLEELNYINKDEEGVHIGATIKYRDIIRSPYCPDILKDIINELASPNIRNMATLTGNVGNASPAGDTLVALYLLDAYLVLQSKDSKRKILVKDFILNYRKTDIHRGEMITEIVIPNFDLKYKYVKVGSRAAESISKISFAGAYRFENGVIADLRFAFGSIGATIIRNKEIENKYIGLDLAAFKRQIHHILKDYDAIINPITDQRSTKDYRKKVAMNLLENFLKNIKE